MSLKVLDAVRAVLGAGERAVADTGLADAVECSSPRHRRFRSHRNCRDRPCPGGRCRRSSRSGAAADRDPRRCHRRRRRRRWPEPRSADWRRRRCRSRRSCCRPWSRSTADQAGVSAGAPRRSAREGMQVHWPRRQFFAGWAFHAAVAGAAAAVIGIAFSGSVQTRLTRVGFTDRADRQLALAGTTQAGLTDGAGRAAGTAVVVVDLHVDAGVQSHRPHPEHLV